MQKNIFGKKGEIIAVNFLKKKKSGIGAILFRFGANTAFSFVIILQQLLSILLQHMLRYRYKG